MRKEQPSNQEQNKDLKQSPQSSFTSWVTQNKEKIKNTSLSNIKQQFKEFTTLENSELYQGVLKGIEFTKKFSTKISDTIFSSQEIIDDITPQLEVIQQTPTYRDHLDKKTERKSKLFEKLKINEAIVNLGDAKMMIKQDLLDIIQTKSVISELDIEQINYVYGDILEHASKDKNYISNLIQNLNENLKLAQQAEKMGKDNFLDTTFPGVLTAEEKNLVSINYGSGLGIRLSIENQTVLDKLYHGVNNLDNHDTKSNTDGFASMREGYPIIVEREGDTVDSDKVIIHEEFHQEVRLGDRLHRNFPKKLTKEIKKYIDTSDIVSKETVTEMYDELLYKIGRSIEEELLAYNTGDINEFNANMFETYASDYGQIRERIAQINNEFGYDYTWDDKLYKLQIEILQGVDAIKELQNKGYSKDWIATTLNNNYNEDTKSMSHKDWPALAKSIPQRTQSLTQNVFKYRTQEFLALKEKTKLTPEFYQEWNEKGGSNLGNIRGLKVYREFKEQFYNDPTLNEKEQEIKVSQLQEFVQEFQAKWHDTEMEAREIIAQKARDAVTDEQGMLSQQDFWVVFDEFEDKLEEAFNQLLNVPIDELKVGETYHPTLAAVLE